MRQFPLEMHTLAPGRVVEWRVRSTAARANGPGGAAGRRASFNQDKHFTVAEESRGADDPVASWLAVTFEVRGPLDQQALAQALLAFVRRHEVLRCEFRRLAGEVACEPLAADELALDAVPVGEFATTDLLRAFLAERFRRSIDTLSWPLFTMGAVLREDSATVYLAFDHIVCDGMSMPIVVNEVLTAYEALCRGESSALPATAPSYLDFAEEQRRRYLSIDAGDERLGYWKSFIARNGEFFPRFPLDLGVEPDRMYPIVNEASPLLDAGEAEVFDKSCLAVDGKPFMGVLAAVALSLREAGGPGVYRGFMPVSERGRDGWSDSVGWFVNTMPIEFDASPGRDFAQVMAGIRAGFGELLRHIDVPFVRAWELLAPQEFAARSWPYPVNFFSYIDMRKCRGAERHEDWRPATHVWSARANGACSWYQRDADGLHMNSIYVDTPAARRTMGDFQEALRETVRDIALSGGFRRPIALTAPRRPLDTPVRA
ncbi:MULTISPECIES: condensation domain-containing protein [unclassified Streptomyces]|uniref:condensation domain-containing protein n=1 Tax=unclassified Streptomyces TaxID=2593676 RepID=UPI002E2EB2F9|nr:MULTISPECIES: condensation domain-containing protein [unclassified Streptomyces]WUC67752.1 condensation domain-containing protein [Streptomyces sp. NBC_00539]